MEDRPKTRTNGFQRPFHPFQVASWVVFGLDVLIYLCCVFALIDHDAKLILAPFYISSVAVLVLACAKATRCNAADPHVLQQDDSALHAEEDNDSMPFCGICNVPVYPRSKHCRVCNKCVDAFDHHCMWINNCIGQANYRSFFVTISSVAVMIGTVLSTCAFLLFSYFDDADAFEQRLQDTPVLGEIPREIFLGLLITVTALNVPLFVLDAQLVALHAFLMSQGMTTYEYIVNKRNGLERRGEAEDGSGGGGAKYGRTNEDGRKGSSGEGAVGRAVRTLPRCMDWIVFCNCGRRSRRPQSAKDSNTANSELSGLAKPAGQAIGAGAKVAAASLGHSHCGAETSVGTTPSKIGCRSDGEGSMGEEEEEEEGPRPHSARRHVAPPASRAPPAAAVPATTGQPLPVAAAAAAAAVGTGAGAATSAAGSADDGAGPGRCLDFGDEACPLWEAGRRYRVPEVLRLREGPEATSSEVGAVPEGSVVAVWEVCKRGRSASGADLGNHLDHLCAFIAVQDGPEYGQQGWVRCCSGKPCGKAPGKPGSRPSSATPLCPKAATLAQPLPSDCRIEDITLQEATHNLPLHMVDAGSPEDRKVEEASALQDKELPCPVTCCAPTVRRTIGPPASPAAGSAGTCGGSSSSPQPRVAAGAELPDFGMPAAASVQAVQQPATKAFGIGGDSSAVVAN